MGTSEPPIAAVVEEVKMAVELFARLPCRRDRHRYGVFGACVRGDDVHALHGYHLASEPRCSVVERRRRPASAAREW